MGVGEKLEFFMQIAKVLNTELNLTPVLYGSLGLWFITDHPFHVDDIDMLVPDEYINGNDKWLDLKLVIERLGFKLVNLHEHEFERDGQKIAFGKISILKKDLSIEIEDLKLTEISGTKFLELNLEQYLFAYKFCLFDSYRQNIKMKRDSEKITFIEKLLNQ